jgi:hypothetical protein
MSKNLIPLGGEIKMEKRFEFVDRTIFLIRKLLEEHLPKEATLDEMVQKRNSLLEKFIK